MKNKSLLLLALLPSLIGCNKETPNPVGEVISRFFYKNTGRSGYFRNTLAKCWWVGHHTYDPLKKFELLEKLGSHDMSTKVTDIFHNYTSSKKRLPHRWEV